jgi:ATP-dependent DNA helicase DinG
LPLVRKALGVPVDVALLKGRANYLCLHHLEVAASQGTFASREDTVHLQKIRRFAAKTMTGDRSDCAEVPENSAAWNQATSTRENCLGSSCRYYSDCYVMKARKRAADAEVIVVNHHLFFADLAMRDEGAGELLGAANTLIFDEAHHLPDLARLFFGQSISTSQALELARDIRLAGAEHARETLDFGERASSLERAARDVRLALGQALGRTPLASLRDKPGFDRALDAFAASWRNPKRSCERTRSVPTKSAMRASARRSCSRASSNGAKPTSVPKAPGMKKGRTRRSCDGSKHFRSRRCSM